MLRRGCLCFVRSFLLWSAGIALGSNAFVFWCPMHSWAYMEHNKFHWSSFAYHQIRLQDTYDLFLYTQGISMKAGLWQHSYYSKDLLFLPLASGHVIFLDCWFVCSSFSCTSSNECWWDMWPVVCCLAWVGLFFVEFSSFVKCWEDRFSLFYLLTTH